MKAKTSMKKSVITTILFCCILSSSFSQKRQIDTLFIANNKYPIERYSASRTYTLDLFLAPIFFCQYRMPTKTICVPFYNELKCEKSHLLDAEGNPYIILSKCDSINLDSLYLSDFIDSLSFDVNRLKWEKIFIKQGFKNTTIAYCEFKIMYEDRIIHYYTDDLNFLSYYLNNKPKLIILQNMIYYDENNVLYILPAEFLIFLK